MKILINNRGMNRRLFLFFMYIPLLSSCTYTFYQAAEPYPVSGAMRRVSVLPDTLNETSGLLEKDGAFFSFNDSQGEAAIFRVNSNSEMLNKTMLMNVTNADWEGIAMDEAFFYIADVGNNFGSRDTLVVYKIPAEEISLGSTEAYAERITFSYDEEVSRTSSGYYSHDCESIFSFGDSLYLFAKDWVTLGTRVYVLPKIPGHYKVQSRVSYPVNALITGADIDLEKREVVLIAYRNFIPIIIKYSYISDPSVIQGGGKARIYPMKIATQTEGICFDEEGNIYISAEKRIRKQALYRAY